MAIFFLVGGGEGRGGARSWLWLSASNRGKPDERLKKGEEEGSFDEREQTAI